MALPALGTGVGGVPLEAAAAAMGAAVRDHAAGPTPVTTVVFALYDQAALERFGAALERELGPAMGAELDQARADGDHLAAGGLLERIVAWAGQVVGTPNGYICLIEPDSGEMVLRVGTGAYTGLVGLRMLKGEGLSGRVWETGQPWPSPTTAPGRGGCRQIAADAFRAVLGVPLVSGGTVTGVIGLAFSEPGRTFSDDQVQQVSRFAEVASIALDNARLYAAAQQELVERQRPSAASGPWSSRSRPWSTARSSRSAAPACGSTPRSSDVRLHGRGDPAANFWKTRAPRGPRPGAGRGGPLRADRRAVRMEYRCFTKTAGRWVRDRACWSATRPAPLYWQGVSVDITDTKRALEHEREVTGGCAPSTR